MPETPRQIAERFTLLPYRDRSVWADELAAAIEAAVTEARDEALELAAEAATEFPHSPQTIRNMKSARQEPPRATG